MAPHSSAFESAWAIIKWDDEDDYYDDDDEWNIMDVEDTCACEGVPYSRCQCPAGCANCQCNLMQTAAQHVRPQVDETEQEENRELKLREAAQMAPESEAEEEEPLELPTIGRELRPDPLQVQDVREQWGEDLDELESRGVHRDYSHLNPKEAAWHQEMDRRARNIPEGLKNYLSDVYERWKRAFEEGNTQIMRDAEELMDKQGGRLRIGELLGDKEAIAQLKEQFEPQALHAGMGFMAPAGRGGQTAVSSDDDDDDDDDDHEARVKRDRARRDQTSTERLLVTGPAATEGRRQYIRHDRHAATPAGYGRSAVRAQAQKKKTGWRGGAEGSGKTHGREIVGVKQSEADMAKVGNTAYINAARKAARLHDMRANAEGAWAYVKPETHPDFEAELPPPGSVVVRDRPKHRGGQRDPKSEKVVIPSSTYRRVHPELREDEEEEE